MVATNVGQRPTHTGRLQSAETADDDVDHGLGMVAQVALRRWLGAPRSAASTGLA
jgi:hypothetical protein